METNVEAQVAAEALRHGGNAALRWCLEAARVIRVAGLSTCVPRARLIASGYCGTTLLSANPVISL